MTNLSEVADTVLSRLIDVEHLVHVRLGNLLVDECKDSQQGTDISYGRDEEDFSERSCLWIGNCSRRPIEDELRGESG